MFYPYGYAKNLVGSVAEQLSQTLAMKHLAKRLQYVDGLLSFVRGQVIPCHCLCGFRRVFPVWPHAQPAQYWR